MSTKVHLAADGRARPLALTVTAGQAGDAPAFEAVMAGIRVPRGGPGRPRTRPLAVLADRAYSSRAIRSHLRRRGIRAVIPQPSDQVGNRLRRGHRGGSASWLIAQWPEGHDEPVRYWISNLPADIPTKDLVRLAKARWRIEHDYRELKAALGLDHFEGRSFTGWHRHVTLVTAAHLFLTEQRRNPKAPARA
ncbi:transposase [Streptomyces sp. NPDC051211]|uniref:transposase n=1 Tax=Streptomyces sp. NPDC051211 TaxID=3154643 RepID=UPI00345074D9